MTKILQFLRVPEWYDSKIPMLLSVLLYIFVLCPGDVEPPRIAMLLLTFFVFCFAYLSFGYVVNDACDMETDRKAGKRKIIAGIPKPIVGLIIASLVFAGILPLYLASGFDLRVLLTLLLNYLLGASYSLKPLRFKERGFGGLIISSSAQRCFPLAVLPMLVQVSWQMFAGWFALSFLAGLRYILIHQYIDYENDLRSGVATFMTKHRSLAASMVYACFGLELLGLLLLLIPLATQHVWFIAVPVGYAAVACSASYAVRNLMRRSVFLSYTYVPLEDYFNVAFPLALIIQLAVEKRSWLLGLCAFVLAAYLAATIRKKGDLMTLPLRVKFGSGAWHL